MTHASAHACASAETVQEEAVTEVHRVCADSDGLAHDELRVQVHPDRMAALPDLVCLVSPSKTDADPCRAVCEKRLGAE